MFALLTNTMTSARALAQLMLETLPLMGQAVVRTMRTEDCPHAMTDVNVLIHVRMLHALSDGPKTFQQMQEFRGVSAATLSRSIDAMVKHGWIERIPHPEDRRQVLLQATDEGRQYFRELVDNARTQLSETLSKLSADERDTIATALELLRRVLHQQP